VEECFEPLELAPVGEDDAPDLGAVGRAEALLEGGAHLWIGRNEVVHDLVAGDRCGAVARERA
jgi:hypothetical protein